MSLCSSISVCSTVGLNLQTEFGNSSKKARVLIDDTGFLVAEFPTQYLAQHLSRLGLYLGVNIMIWGLILALHAACTSFAGLAIVRTLLGVFESWYVPPEGNIGAHRTLTPMIVLPRF